MRLVIDSSLIVKHDWYLTTGPAQALLAAAQRGQIRLIVPEVVVREVVNKHAEERRAATDRVKSALADLRRLDGPESPSRTAAVPESPRETYEARLRERLADANVDVPPIPEITDALVTRALARRRPFTKEGKVGFRDALIWQAVLDGASDDAVSLLVAFNPIDFANDTKDALHPHLVEDVTSRGLSPDAVLLVQSFQEAANAALDPAWEIAQEIQDLLASDADWTSRLTDLLQEAAAIDLIAVEDHGVDIQLEEGAEPFGNEIIGLDLEEADLLGPPRLTTTFGLGDNVFTVRFAVPARAYYEVEIGTSGFWRNPKLVPDDLRLSRNEASAYFSAFADGDALFDARYDARGKTISDVSFLALAPA